MLNVSSSPFDHKSGIGGFTPLEISNEEKYSKFRISLVTVEILAAFCSPNSIRLLCIFEAICSVSEVSNFTNSIIRSISNMERRESFLL